MAQANVLKETAGAVALLTINRPDKRNALNEPTRGELIALLEECQRDAAIRVVIITGAGDKAFIAGADISEFAGRSAVDQYRVMKAASVYHAVDAFPKPIIAAINGFCLGGGCELAMACDIRIAADHARFGVVNRRWNVGCESGLTQRLPHIVGLGVALDLILTGRWFDAKEALAMHFVTRVVPRRRLMDEAIAMAEQICAYPQSSLRTDKEALIRGLGMTLDEGLRLECALWNTNLGLRDTLEGPRAFVEKRKFVPTNDS